MKSTTCLLLVLFNEIFLINGGKEQWVFQHKYLYSFIANYKERFSLRHDSIINICIFTLSYNQSENNHLSEIDLQLNVYMYACIYVFIYLRGYLRLNFRQNFISKDYLDSIGSNDDHFMNLNENQLSLRDIHK